jgi:hypothetical protein
MDSLPVVAGSVATTIFVLSSLPMLLKARRTRDLSSYSLGNICLANLGNAVQSLYVLSLPPGPIWVLHAFQATTTGLMLGWYLRYQSRSSRARVAPQGSVGDDHRRELALEHLAGRVARQRVEEADVAGRLVAR